MTVPLGLAVDVRALLAEEAINLEEVGHEIRASILMHGLTKREFNALRPTPALRDPTVTFPNLTGCR